MKALSPNQMAYLLPLTMLAHQVEEYLGGFPVWYSNLLNVQLSNQDFLWINGIGLLLITVYALFYLSTRNNTILVALGTLILVNGIIHLALSIVTFNYSPGTITGVVLFLPLGTVIFSRIMPQLDQWQRTIAIAIGIMILFVASFVAMTI